MGKIIKNIATIGYIDSGKTTLTDYLMFLSRNDGRTRRGSIRKGDTKTDILQAERDSGITINSVPVEGFYFSDSQNYALRIIDTPGHSEFRYQVHTALDGVEGALLLIDMNKGYHNYTTDLLNALRQSELPFITILNKADLVHKADFGTRLERIISEFDKRGIDLAFFQEPVFEGNKMVNVYDLLVDKQNIPPEKGQIPDLSHSLLSLLSEDEVPAMFLSSESGSGIDNGFGGHELLAYSFDYFPGPNQNQLFQSLGENSKHFSGKVINRIPKKSFHKGTVVMRVISGDLKRGARVLNPNKDEKIRLPHLYTPNGDMIRSASAGDIVLVDGLERTLTTSGDTLCYQSSRIIFPHSTPIRQPIISAEIFIDGDMLKALKTLDKLTKYDPSWSYEPLKQSIKVNSSNRFHLSKLIDILIKDFGVPIKSQRFMPRYVAAPVEKCETIGEDYSKDSSYLVLLKNVCETGDSLNFDEFQNTFSANNQELRSLVNILKQTFTNLKYHDNFPLVNFSLQVERAYSPTKKTSQVVRYNALMEALDILLYGSENISLYEPYIQIQTVTVDKNTHRDIERLFHQLYPSKLDPGSGPKSSLWSRDDLIISWNSDDEHIQQNIALVKAYLGNVTTFPKGVYEAEVEIPVSTFLDKEVQIKKTLSRAYEQIYPTCFHRVPIDKAVELILDSCGYRSKEPVYERQKIRDRRYRNDRILPKVFPSKVISQMVPTIQAQINSNEPNLIRPDYSKWAGGKFI